MCDRLGDLHKAAGIVAIEVDSKQQDDQAASAKGKKSPSPKNAGSKAAADGAGKTTQAPGFMEGFFRDVDAVKEDINALKSAVRRIGEVQQEAYTATTTKHEKALSLKLNDIINVANPKAQRAKALLEKIKDETIVLRKNDKVKSSEISIRDNLLNTLTRKFVETMTDYQSAQNKYKSSIKKKVERQIQIIKPDATPEDVEAVMKSGGNTDRLIQQSILKGAKESIKQVHATVAEKYQDVRMLEASIAELHQMFLDFALLVEAQGEMLDSIEYQVKSSANSVVLGNENVIKAIENQKKGRATACWLSFIIVGVLAAIFVAFFVFKKKFK